MTHKRSSTTIKRIYEVGRWHCLLAVATFVLSGCATLFHSSTEKIELSSQPGGAMVFLDGQYVGRTPLQVNLSAKHKYSIEFRKDGYENKIVLLNNSVGAGWIILDILGGIVPILVDAQTGDWFSLDQEHVTAMLEAQKAN